MPTTVCKIKLKNENWLCSNIFSIDNLHSAGPISSGPQCNKPLGMQNGRIRATQITASSSWDKNHAPNNGRLFFRRTGSRMGAWCARHNNRYQWLSVDFGRAMRVVKIATQGRHDARQWVTQYYLSFSQDNVFFAEYKQNSARRVRRPGQTVCDVWCHIKWFCAVAAPNTFNSKSFRIECV